MAGVRRRWKGSAGNSDLMLVLNSGSSSLKFGLSITAGRVTKKPC